MRIIITIIFIIAISIAVYAEMTERIIVLQEGESINLIDEVPWPVETAWADFDPPVMISGALANTLVFVESFNQRIHGPTTIRLRWGSISSPSSPDAISGGE